MKSMQIIYYTDPLCCWSWVMEPALERLRTKLGAQAQWRYCMGGLLPDWNSFVDPVNSVTRPIQMGPVWMHAAEVGGVKIDHSLWFRDPPASSYPACVAVKCVELQSAAYVPGFLQKLREECMTNGLNIAKEEVLLNTASMLQKQFPSFNSDRFTDDLCNGNGREAFRADLHEVQVKNITRFPSLLIRRPEQPSILIAGYRQYESLMELFAVADEVG